MATIDLCTLTDLKSWLGITTTNSDVTLTRLITAGSSAFLSRLKRNPCQSVPGTYTLYQQTITEKYSGGGGDTLLLRCFPVISVASVVISPQWGWLSNGAFGPGVVQQSNGSSPGWSFEPNDIRILRMIGYRFPWGVNNISVTYTSGYNTITALPQDIQQAVIELCSKKFRQKDSSIGQDTVAMGSMETIRFSTRDFTPDVMAVINDYRDRVPR
jgi:hypothetical protein